MTDETGSPRRRRAAGDSGTALVELAFVSVLLLTLVFGIISFGLILSFKQDMTRAAAEGARAGAVALPVGAQTFEDAATTKAEAAVREAVLEFGGSFSTAGCDRAGMSGCDTVVVAACDEEPLVDCVTVQLAYDYDAEPLFGDVPLLSAFLPDIVEATSVARING